MGTIWNQSGGTLSDTNSITQYGFGAGITSTQIGVGESMTSFSLYLKRTASYVSHSLTFGVWASGNNTATPTSTFTGSIDEIGDLTTSFVEYTFTGSHTLADGDTVGVYWGNTGGYQYINQEIAPPDAEANTNYMKYTVSSWNSYGSTNPPNMHAQGSGPGPSPGGSTFMPPPIAHVRL